MRAIPRQRPLLRGKESERKTEQFEPTVGASIRRIEREYIFTRTIGRLEIVVTATVPRSHLSRYRLLGFHGYPSEELSVSLPSDRDIAIGGNPTWMSIACMQQMY